MLQKKILGQSVLQVLFYTINVKSFKSFFMNLYYFILYWTSSFQSTYAYWYLQALKMNFR